MFKSPSLRYQEDFHSVLREISTWLWLLAAVLIIFIIGGLIMQISWMTEAFIKPFFFIFLGCIFAAVFFKTTKTRGRIEVLSHELKIYEEGEKETFRKKDIQYFSIGELSKGRSSLDAHTRSWRVRFQNQNGTAADVPCMIKPYHFSWRNTYKGVVILTSKADRPLFVPTRNQKELLQALVEMS